MKIQGLSNQQASELNLQFGLNILPVKEKYSWFDALIDQFKSPLIFVLFLVAGVSLFFGEITDAILVLGVVILDVGMGFYQEYNAQKTLSALRQIIKPMAIVIREGERKEIEAKYLVPGDVVVLGSGDKIPADGFFLESVNFLVNEAILTGEQEAVLKQCQEPNCRGYMGSTVLSGRAVMQVDKIGEQTEIGKIGKKLSEIKDEETPLQKSLDKFSHNLLLIILGVCALIFLVGLIYQKPVLEMLRLSIILAVAAIPEGLPVAITLILAIGMKRILDKKGLVKKLISIETLGVTSVICTDKTGTLTEGNMRVIKSEFVDKEPAHLAMILANDQKSNLEAALWNYAANLENLSPKEVFDSAKRTFEVSFDSQKKYMLVNCEIDGREIAYAKGAPEIVLAACQITPEAKQKALETINSWTSQGLRVLGLANKAAGNLRELAGMNWLGLLAIDDPLRAQAKDSIRQAQAMGMKVKIVTGDYLNTARNIAERLGFDVADSHCIIGDELEKLSDQQLQEKVKELFVFARITPLQKMRIVQVLQNNGEIVAMTGDGVNDAPALKKANIGVVVGNGTDVAKEAGDLILLDNNFQTIVDACEEGRLIFANIKKVVGYTLSNSFAEIILILGAILLNMPAPLLIAQILWIHFICDGPLDLLLGFEPKEESIREQRPEILRKESILDKSMLAMIIGISSITGILAFYSFVKIYQYQDLALARSVAFAVLAVVDLIYVFSFKNLHRLIFNMKNFWENKPLLWGIGGGFAMVFLALYVPVIQKSLETKALNWQHWMIILSISLLDLVLVEIIKFVNIIKNRLAKNS